MDRDPARIVEFEGCLNFRDLGGVSRPDGQRIRCGVIYRSDALHRLTGRDIERLRDELRIGHVIDLRSTPEVELAGRGPLGDEPIAFHHLPLYDGSMSGPAAHAFDLTLAERYFALLEIGKPAVSAVLRTLAGASAPAVFHCAAGKDRTGLVAALLLGLLGVSDEGIAADYALTRENLGAIVERLQALEGYQTVLEALPPDTMHAEPGTMLALLAQIRDHYGEIRGYAASAGVSNADLARLESRLLERPTAS
jgi:protein tyrosine/serine phosphatase